MAHMEPQYYDGPYVAVDTEDLSTTYLPQDVWADLGEEALESPASAVTEYDGVLSRLSAPGYMDCTDWTPADTEKDAREAFRADGLDPDTGDELDADA